MDLILWRHAEAAPAREGQADEDRPLTSKGERQAQRMADWLNRRIAQSTKVIASPALRCQQTVAPLGRSAKRVAALAPGGTVEGLLAAAKWPDASEPVLVVGHQPTLGEVLSHLLGGREPSWAIKKGAVWWLRWREREGEDEPQLTVVAVQSPDLL
jgi:phosphohistidine phosphatase